MILKILHTPLTDVVVTLPFAVSNFSIKTLKELEAGAGPDYVVPAINQVELSPDLPQTELLEYCKEKGIHVTAWSPL